MVFNSIGPGESSGGGFSGALDFQKGYTMSGSQKSNMDQLGSVIFENGKFIGYGDRGIYYSKDGKQWTACTDTPKWVDKVVFGSGVFVASVGSQLYYSSDGVTWTTGTNLTLSSPTLVYGGGKFYMYGYGSSNYKRMASSDDGITWKEEDFNPPWLYYPNPISTDNTIFHLYQGTGYVSFDGNKWFSTNPTTEYQASDLLCISVDKKYYAFAQGKTNYNINVSYDGLNWTRGSQSIQIEKVYGLQHYNGIFFAANSSMVYYSYDAENWAKCEGVAGRFSSLTDIACGNGMIVANTNFAGMIYAEIK